MSPTSSWIGTINGGSEMMRGSPSTSWVSLANAFRLSLVCAFAAAFLTVLICCLCFSAASPATSCWTSSREYQTLRLPIAANDRIPSR